MKKQLHPKLTLPFSAFHKPENTLPFYQEEEPIASFCVLADTHIRQEGYRIKRFNKFYRSFGNMKQRDALVFCGDITDRGIASNWELVDDLIPGTPMFMVPCMGNHDTWEEDDCGGFMQAQKHFINLCHSLSGLQNEKVYYKTTVKGIPFLVLGRDNEKEPHFSEEQIAFLDKELSACDPHKPVFVVSHYAVNKTHGLPVTFGDKEYNDFTGGFEACSDKINAVLQKYPNVILFSGHSHMGLNHSLSFQKVGNIYSLNLPCFMFFNHHGLIHCGIGYIVEVYEHKILFRPRSFLRNRWLPEYNREIFY